MYICFDMILIQLLTGLICIFPVFLIFLDYHKKGNIQKAIVYILSFFSLLLIFTFILLPLFSFYIVLLIPACLFIYLVINELKRF
jgi:hypothetical protein